MGVEPTFTFRDGVHFTYDSTIYCTSIKRLLSPLSPKLIYFFIVLPQIAFFSVCDTSPYAASVHTCPNTRAFKRKQGTRPFEVTIKVSPWRAVSTGMDTTSGLRTRTAAINARHKVNSKALKCIQLQVCCRPIEASGD